LPGRALVGVVTYDRTKHYVRGAGSETINGMNKRGHFETWRNPGSPGKYFPNSMKEINPPEGTEVFHLDLALEKGSSVRLRVVDPQGKPIRGALIAGRTGRGEHERDTKAESDLDVIALGPGEERTVLIQHNERGLGKSVQVRAGDDKNGPIVVVLEPMGTIIGQVLDADGSPVSGATVWVSLLPSGDYSLSLDRVTTDKRGYFQVPDVPTGCEYSLVVESGATKKERKVAFFPKASVRPGQATDVGDIRFK
jgi:hypothetical protein